MGNVISDDSLVNVPTGRRFLDVSDTWQISLHLPENGYAFALKTSQADYVLWIESINTDRDGGAGSIENDYGERYGGKGEALVQRVVYGLWDNRAGRLVSWGLIESRIRVLAFATKGIWEQGIENIVRQMVVESPLMRY